METNSLYTALIANNPDLKDRLDTNSIITAYRGSVAHNLYIEPEHEFSTDDVDIISIGIPEKHFYFPVNKSLVSKDSITTYIDSFDIVWYEFVKAMSMMTQCNPNLLPMLWLNDEHYIKVSRWGELLIANRDAFASRLNVYNAFTGYARQQIDRLQRGATDASYMGAKRRALVEEYGYDTRYAAHAIRLFKMGIEYLLTGKLNVFRESDREELISIKQGKLPLEYVKEYAIELEEVAKESVLMSVLPDAPDFEWIQKFTTNCVLDALARK